MCHLQVKLAYKNILFQVNSNLVEKFECLEDFKLITLLSAYNQNLKVSFLYKIHRV